jgi:7-dehydrocholesterol reductase
MGSDNGEKTTWGAGAHSNVILLLGSLLLMSTTPVFCLTIYNIITQHQGSFTLFWEHYKASEGILTVLQEVVPVPNDARAWQLIGCFAGFELALMRLIPGRVFKATCTATGHVPEYIANGFQCYVISIATLFGLYYHEVFDPAEVYDKMPVLLSSMNAFALAFCAFLTFKGLYFPSTKDSGSNGSFVVDYFWGTELYPRVLGFDVKQSTNCRFGMMFWQIGILCYGFKQYQLLGGHLSSSMAVSILVQTVYIAKFFWWETGYFCSMDIQHDRAGYYICWGCLVWVPSMYTVHTAFLVEHPVMLSFPTAMFFLFGGIFCIWCNYDCDRYVAM